jgi:hypothetical protein
MVVDSMTAEVIVLEPALAALRDHFIGWQCRIRQICVRQNGGEPIPGMRPRVFDRAGNRLTAGMTTLLSREDPTAWTDMFRQAYRRTGDPRERYSRMLEMLAGTYFQKPKEFQDELTASFARDSALASRLVAERSCILEFEQFNQGYRLPCVVADLASIDISYQATYWHNILFNPHLPPDPRILAFTPIWAEASASPPIEAA